jgi:hypothetical protein
MISTRSGSIKDGLQALLSSITKIQTILTADDLAATHDLVRQYHPAVLILEGYEQDPGVREALYKIHQSSSGTRSILLVEQMPVIERDLKPDVIVYQGMLPGNLVQIIEDLLV